MQIVIEIKKEQDLQVLLPLLERLKIAYKSLPAKVSGKDKILKPTKLSAKYAGKIPAKVGLELQKHIAQSRSEWERI